jgi:Uma2 family endonuclease
MPANAISAASPEGEPIYRVSIEQYHEMVARGILTHDDPVELLEGLLARKMRKTPRHVVVLELTAAELRRMVPVGWYEDMQHPITFETSEPEPDVAVIRGKTRDYYDRHPGPADVALVIEVADGTLLRDLGIKRRIYARGAIPIYWVIDVDARRVEVFTQPSGTAENALYSAAKTYGESDVLPVMIDGREVGQIALRDILP